MRQENRHSPVSRVHPHRRGGGVVAPLARTAVLCVATLSGLGAPLALTWAARIPSDDARATAIDRELNLAGPVVSTWVESGRLCPNPDDHGALILNLSEGEWASLPPTVRHGATIFLAGLAARRQHPRPFVIVDECGCVLHRGEPARLP